MYVRVVRRVVSFDAEPDPAGAFVAARTCAHFCAAPTLWGIVAWGRPDRSDAFDVGRTLVAELAPRAVPHATFLDLTRVTGVDPLAFDATGWYLEHYREPLTRMIRGAALIRPRGLDGASIAGAFAVLPRPYPVEVFADAAIGYAWLRERHGAADWPADAAFLDQLHEDATGVTPLLATVRAAIEQDLDLTLEAAAKRAGMSERTLQRKLGELATTFQAEVIEARLHLAKKLLAETDRPVTAIALDVGFSSLQHFSAAFRKREGCAPSEFRKRR